MREPVKQFVKLCAETLPFAEPIYEFGALQVRGQEGYADLRPYFPGRRYIGADMRDGPGVDVLLDLHDIDLPAGAAGSVLMLETLEHVEFPRKALAEVHRVLRPNGMLVATSLMDFQIHDYPADYWRFTPQGFASLFRDFESVCVDFAGHPLFPHMVLAVAFKGPQLPPVSEAFLRGLRQFRRAWRRPSGDPWLSMIDRWRRLLRPWLPRPVLRSLRKWQEAKRGPC